MTRLSRTRGLAVALFCATFTIFSTADDANADATVDARASAPPTADGQTLPVRLLPPQFAADAPLSVELALSLLSLGGLLLYFRRRVHAGVAVAPADPSPRPSGTSVARVGELVPLEEARADLQTLETLEREVAALVSVLRDTLPPEQFRLVWALRDAEERLELEERDVRERHLVEGLARRFPEHAPAIRVASRDLLEEDVDAIAPG